MNLVPRDELTLNSIYPLSLTEWVSSCMLETLLYGILLVLSSVGAFILIKNKTSNHWRWLLSAGCIMLTLATVDVILGYYVLFHFVLQGKGVPFRYVYPKYYLYVTNNIIADCLIIHRCYMIWSRNKRVIALPVLLLVITSACGYIFLGGRIGYRTRAVYVFMTCGLNFFISILMAARVFWIYRQLSAVLGPLARKYRYAMGLIIESGTIYWMYLFFDLLFGEPQLNFGLIQIVAIVPTLIIVQVGLGRQMGDVDETVELLRSGFQSISRPSKSGTTEIRSLPGGASMDASV